MVNERMGNTMEDNNVKVVASVACMSDVPEHNKNEFVEGKGVVLVAHSGTTNLGDSFHLDSQVLIMGEFSQETAAIMVCKLIAGLKRTYPMMDIEVMGRLMMDAAEDEGE